VLFYDRANRARRLYSASDTRPAAASNHVAGSGTVSVVLPNPQYSYAVAIYGGNSHY
jgi:hypothetical protein